MITLSRHPGDLLNINEVIMQWSSDNFNLQMQAGAALIAQTSFQNRQWGMWCAHPITIKSQTGDCELNLGIRTSSILWIWRISQVEVKVIHISSFRVIMYCKKVILCRTMIKALYILSRSMNGLVQFSFPHLLHKLS